MGFPNPSITLPNNPIPTLTVKLFPVALISQDGEIFCTSPRAIESTLPSLKPTTSDLQTSFPSLSIIVQISPSETLGPIETITSPITSETFPFTIIGSNLSIILLYLEEILSATSIKYLLPIVYLFHLIETRFWHRHYLFPFQQGSRLFQYVHPIQILFYYMNRC